jgi:lipoic acid synthetase
MGECWGENCNYIYDFRKYLHTLLRILRCGRPETVDWDEPEKVARSIKIMNIKHAVITSVDRDDLKMVVL